MTSKQSQNEASMVKITKKSIKLFFELSKNYNGSDREKDPDSRNSDKENPQNFLGAQVKTHFGFILKSFNQCRDCFSVHLPLLCKKWGLKHFCDLFQMKQTIIIYSCIFDLQYTVISDIGTSLFS